MDQKELLKRIMEINKDESLSDAQKATARQDLMSGKWKQQEPETTQASKGEHGSEHGTRLPLLVGQHRCHSLHPTSPIFPCRGQGQSCGGRGR